MSGFRSDTSAETQARRARKANTPWRHGPQCDTPAARLAYLRYRAKANARVAAPAGQERV